MATAVPTEVGPGVHRVADGMVNFYLLEDDATDEVALVDTGFPRSTATLEDVPEATGHTAGDLSAILLTHGHPDHQGQAEDIRRRVGCPVHAHHEEVPALRGQAPDSSLLALVPDLLPQLLRPSVLGSVLHATLHGFLTPKWLEEVEPVADGDRLEEVPGSPTVVHTPGHTSGHVAFHLADRGVLLSGDALVTVDVLTRKEGPRLLPRVLNTDDRQARTSLKTLAHLEGETVLPGHGAPYRGSISRAVEVARGRARDRTAEPAGRLS